MAKLCILCIVIVSVDVFQYAMVHMYRKVHTIPHTEARAYEKQHTQNSTQKQHTKHSTQKQQIPSAMNGKTL